MKKLIATLLALVLVVGLSATVFAADYTKTPNNAFTGIPSDAQNLTYISADGSDEDTIPDLVTGYYVFNKDDASFAARNIPGWDTFYGSQVYVKSLSNTWGINRGEKAAAQSDGGQDENGYYRLKDGVKFYSHKIWVGIDLMGASNSLDYGIGVQPSKKDAELQNYVLVNVDGFNHFYAITAITGSAFNQNATNIPEQFGGTGVKGVDSNTGSNTVVYEIWGSTKAIADTETESKAGDSSFKKIATCEIGATETGEFNVDISGYKTLKLVTTVGAKTGSNGGTNCVWGNAAVYNLASDSSTPSTPDKDEPSKTADTFTGMIVALFVLSAGAVVALTTSRKRFF